MYFLYEHLNFIQKIFFKARQAGRNAFTMYILWNFNDITGKLLWDVHHMHHVDESVEIVKWLQTN